MAGARVVIALRAADHCVSSTLISEETYLTYDRPTLSKPAITSDEEPTPALLLDDAQLRSLGVNFIRNGKAVKLDVKAKTISLSNGVSVQYEKLLMTTDAKLRKLNIQSGEHALPLGKFSDVENLHAQFKSDKKIFIIGGGFIGLELAASTKKCRRNLMLAQPQKQHRRAAKNWPRPKTRRLHM